MPKMSRYPPPPVDARYRCGFPGCSKRYASTDGVRKHARKAHNGWLRQVDAHSGMRDKAVDNKPSTYCIMECEEGEQQGVPLTAPFDAYVPRVEGPAPRADEHTIQMGAHQGMVPPQFWQCPPGNGVLEHSALEMGRSLTLLNALTAAHMPINPAFAGLAGLGPLGVLPPQMQQFPSLAAALAPAAASSLASSPSPSESGSDDVCTPPAGPMGPAMVYETPGRMGKAGTLRDSPPPFELEPPMPSKVGLEAEAPVEPCMPCKPPACALEPPPPMPMPMPLASEVSGEMQMSDEAFFSALLAL